MSLSSSASCAVCKQPLSPHLSLTETSTVHKIMSYFVMNKKTKNNTSNKNEYKQNNDIGKRVTCSRCNKVCCMNCVVWHRYGTSVKDNCERRNESDVHCNSNDKSCKSENTNALHQNVDSENNLEFTNSERVAVCTECEEKPNLIRSLPREVWHTILSYCALAEQQTMMQLCHCTQLGVDLPNYTYSPRGWCAFFNSKELIYNGSLGPVYCTTLRSGIEQTLYESCITPSLVRLLYNKKVAVKVINKSRVYSLRQWGHVQREIDALVRCTKCRNVVSFYFALQGPSEVYLVMEYVSGGDLFDWLTQQSLPMESEVKVIAVQLLQTIHDLHEICGVVHRDIKPENILLEYSHEEEEESKEEEEEEEERESYFMHSAQYEKLNNKDHNQKLHQNNKYRLHIRLADFGYAKLLPLPNESKCKHRQLSLNSQDATWKREQGIWNEVNEKGSKPTSVLLHGSTSDPSKRSRCTLPLVNDIKNMNSKTYLSNDNEINVANKENEITNVYSNVDDEKIYKCYDFPHFSQRNTVLDKENGHCDDIDDNYNYDNDNENDDDNIISHKFNSFLIPATPCGTLGFAPPETVNAYTAKKKALDYVQSLINHDDNLTTNTAFNAHSKQKQQHCKESGKRDENTRSKSEHLQEKRNEESWGNVNKDMQFTKNYFSNASHSEAAELSHFKIADPLTSIEQIKRMDIFAAGVTLCILLTGCEPFPCESSKAHIEAVFRGVDFTAEEWSYVSFDAKNLIRQMLSPNAADRPSAKECLQSSWMKYLTSHSTSSVNATMTTTAKKNSIMKNNIITDFNKRMSFSKEVKKPNLPTGPSHLSSVNECNHSTHTTNNLLENDSLSNITSDAFYINVPQCTSSLRTTAMPLTITETLSQSFRNSVGSLRRNGRWLFVQDATGSLTTMSRLSVKGDEEKRVFDSHYFIDEHTNNASRKSNVNVISNNCTGATTNSSSTLQSKSIII